MSHTSCYTASHTTFHTLNSGADHKVRFDCLESSKVLTFQFPGEGWSLLGQRGACPGLPLQGGPAHLPPGQPGLVRPKEGEEGGEGGAGREEDAGQESDFVAVRVPPHCFGQNLSLI